MNFEPLTQFLDSLIPYGIPGVDMLVMQNHRPLYRHHAGWRDREAQEPIRGDELYLLYSCSKVTTVVAAMQLLEKGKFLLTDPLCEYMPEWRDVLVRDADGGAHRAQNPILIRHLFSMTAGLDYEMDRPAIRRVREETAGACPTRAIARALSEKPLSFEPGAHWQYSLCHDVLAALVEVVSGEKFSDYVTGHIFRPLGMTRTCYHLQPGMEKDLAAQYRYNDEARRAERIAPDNSYEFGPEYDSGGAGVISCVDDYIRLADALACGGAGATGERILSGAAIDLLRANQLNDAQMHDFNWVQMAGYGYGLGVRTAINRAGGLLCPMGEFGWGGAAGAYFSADPQNRISIYYAQHMLNNKEPYVHPRLRNLVYSCLER